MRRGQWRTLKRKTGGGSAHSATDMPVGCKRSINIVGSIAVRKRWLSPEFCGRTTLIKSIFDDPLQGEQRVRLEGWILDGLNMVLVQPFVFRLPSPTLARKIDVLQPTIQRIPFLDMSAPWLQVYREDRQAAQNGWYIHPSFVHVLVLMSNQGCKTRTITDRLPQFSRLPIECRNKIYTYLQDMEYPIRS